MFSRINLQNIKAFFKTERALLLLCMSIALFFWLLVQLSQQHTTELKIPLLFNVPKGKILKAKPPEYILVRLKAKGWNLFYRAFRQQSMVLTWNINQDKSLNYSDLKNKIEGIISDKIEIIDIFPNAMICQLDKHLQKQIPIEINASIQPVAQFQLSNNIQLLPGQITITGPASVIKNINRIKTKKITIKNLRQNQYGEIDLLLFKNKQIKYAASKVNYMATIEQFSEKILQVPIQIQADSAVTIRVMPPTVKVSFTVGLSKFESTTPDDFELFVDAQALDLEKTMTLPVKIITTPNWVRNIKITPRNVEFVIMKRRE